MIGCMLHMPTMEIGPTMQFIKYCLLFSLLFQLRASEDVGFQFIYSILIVIILLIDCCGLINYNFMSSNSIYYPIYYVSSPINIGPDEILRDKRASASLTAVRPHCGCC